MTNEKMKRIIWTGLFAALTVTATIIVFPFPSPNGYVNAGDALVIVSAFFLGPVYGALAAGLGSALADLFLGYTVYIPATLVIKALMAFVAASILKRTTAKNMVISAVLAGIVAELIMVAGYFCYELMLYGFAGAMGAVIGNCIQGVFGAAAGCALFLALKKIPYVRDNF